MVFQDPILAGVSLVRDAIQSEGYIAGQQGWIIRRDGSAEFNAGTYRGPVIVNDSTGREIVHIDSNGLKVTPSSGTGFLKLDRDPASSETARIVLVPNGWPAGGGREGQVWATGPGVDPKRNDQLIIDSPCHGGQTWSRIKLESSDNYGNPTAMNVLADNVTFKRAEGDVGTAVFLDLKQDGTGGINAVRGGIVETWKPLSLRSGWANWGAAATAAQVRLVPSPSNEVRVIGRIVGGATASGTVIANLDVPYRPATNVPMHINNHSGFTVVVGNVAPSGDISVYGTFGADLSFNALIPRGI